MSNISEILDLAISVVLFIYLLSLIKKDKSYIKTYWFLGILFILFSKVSTIIEEIIFYNQANLAEHLSFLIGCIMLLISILKKEL